MDKNTENAQPKDERILRITEIFLFVVLTAIIIYQLVFGGAFIKNEGFFEVNEPLNKSEQVSVHSVKIQK